MSILRSIGAGKIYTINKIVGTLDFTPENIAILENAVAAWKPKDLKELINIIEKYINFAGEKCSLNWIDVSNITNMAYVFEGSAFNGDISKWDVRRVKNMFCIVMLSL